MGRDLIGCALEVIGRPWEDVRFGVRRSANENLFKGVVVFIDVPRHQRGDVTNIVLIRRLNPSKAKTTP